MSAKSYRGKTVEKHVDNVCKTYGKKCKTRSVNTGKNNKNRLKEILDTDGKNLSSREVEARVRFLFRDIGCFEAEVDMTAWYAKVYRVIGEKKAYFISKDCRKEGVHSPTKLLHFLLKKAVGGGGTIGGYFR